MALKTYRVYYNTVASTSVTVEAEDESEARDKADEIFPSPGLCAHCSGWGQDYSMDLGDWEQDDFVDEDDS